MIVKKIQDKWRVDYRSPYDGKRHRIYSPDNSRRGAEALLVRLQQNMVRGLPLFKTEENQETFNEFCEEWFSTYVMPTNKPSEQSTKESILRVHLRPWFGTTKLKDISVFQIEQYKADKIKHGLSAKTVNNHLAVLAKCLKCALDWEKIDKMPRITKLRAVSQRLVFLSPLESRKLIEERSEPLWNDMILLALHTGMRFGELLGLEWDDIDMKKRMIAITRSQVRGITGTPKNGKIRFIKMSDTVYRMLENRHPAKGSVFQNNKDKVNYKTAANAIRRICKRAGVKVVSWHILRHTFASTLVAEGAPLPVVQQLLGHASIVMTMKYAHLAPSAMSDAIGLLEQAENRAIQESGH